MIRQRISTNNPLKFRIHTDVVHITVLLLEDDNHKNSECDHDSQNCLATKVNVYYRESTKIGKAF